MSNHNICFHAEMRKIYMDILLAELKKKVLCQTEGSEYFTNYCTSGFPRNFTRAIEN